MRTILISLSSEIDFVWWIGFGDGGGGVCGWKWQALIRILNLLLIESDDINLINVFDELT